MNQSHLPSLSGLRGVAALIVVISHFSNNTRFLDATLGRGGGQLGVMLFFVLSAFLMMLVYHESGISPARFMWNRFARVYPLYFVSIFVSAGLGLISPGLNFLNIGTGQIVPHIYFRLGNSILWTIGPEILFYAVFAGLLFLPRLWRTLVVIVTGAGLMMAWTHVNAVSWTAALGFAGPIADHHNAFKFFAFGLLAYLAVRRVPDVTGWPSVVLAVVAASGLLVSYPVIHRMVFGHLPAVSGWNEPSTAIAVVCFLLAAVKVGALRSILSSRVLVWTGDVSFSLYIFHLLVLRLLSGAGLMKPTLWSLALMVASALALAWIIHVAFERPVREWLRRLPDRLAPHLSRFRPAKQR